MVHLIRLESLTFEAIENDKVLLEIAKKLYESPYHPQPLSSKFVSDTIYERLSFIQKQQEMIQQQHEQLEANDKLLHEQTVALQLKQMELEAADKRINEELKAHAEKIEHLVDLTSPAKKRKGEEREQRKQCN